MNLDATKRYFNGSARGWGWMLVQFPIYNPGKLYKFTWLQSPGTIMLIHLGGDEPGAAHRGPADEGGGVGDDLPYLVILGAMVWGYAFLFPHLVP